MCSLPVMIVPMMDAQLLKMGASTVGTITTTAAAPLETAAQADEDGASCSVGVLCVNLPGMAYVLL